MKNNIILGASMACVIFLFYAGCSKKVVKISEPPSKQAEKPVRTPIPTQSDSEGKAEKKPAEKETVRRTLVLKDVNFDFDKDDLRPDSREILAGHARQLRENSQVKILIEGHCDERGTIEYNLALGERRANAVKNYFKSYGIDTDRLSTISYGKERPLNPNRTEAAWAKNRRAAFKIVLP
ncbi:MAG: peptidoglycan-associated lipoprotein Pal [bacterium]